MAAWKQTASAAASKAMGVHYAQVLLDLLNGFERFPHRVLVREAARFEYHLWMLKFSLATRFVERVVRIGATLSHLVMATRGA